MGSTFSLFTNGAEPQGEPRLRRFAAVTAAIALSGAGLIGTSVVANADPSESDANASSLTCSPANPMGAATPIGSESGYTIFVKEDALLKNSELEGTLAVGGTATFPDSGQYPIMHSTGAGNADYNVPTIDGTPNRVLIQKFGVGTSGKVVQVKAQGGTSDANKNAGAKIGDQSSPNGYTFGSEFGGSGTTYFPSTGGNQSPQIESQVQPWTDLAAAQKSWGIKGDVLSQFPADTGTSTIRGFKDWVEVKAPVGNDQTVALNGGPSKLALSDFARIEKFKLENYSEKSFLVITVADSDVVNGKVTLPSYSFAGNDAQNKEGISYILFDFSGVTIDVDVVSASDRVRGAIYAPNTKITMSQGQFEGQIIAKSFEAFAGGEEIHTNLFKGAFPCTEPAPEVGGFELSKAFSGVTADQFPEATVFNVTATWEGGSGQFALPVDGSVVKGPQDLPVGTVVTFSEPIAPELEGYEFTGVSFSPEKVTIAAGTSAAVKATNTYEKNKVVTGSFSLQKVLSGVSAAEFPEGTTFPVTASWEGGSKEFALPADGSVVEAGVELPVGTVVTLVEGDLPVVPEGYSFVSKSLSSDSIVIPAADADPVAWTVTNTYEKNQVEVGGFDLSKVLKGVESKSFPKDTVFTVVASWTIDGKVTEQEFKLPVDGTLVEGVHDLPVGTVVKFSEPKVPTLKGYKFKSVEFTAKELTIQAGEIEHVKAENTYVAEKLPVTGSNAAAFALVGGLLVLGGGLVLALRRRNS